jgi:hypothetical protein
MRFAVPIAGWVTIAAVAYLVRSAAMDRRPPKDRSRVYRTAHFEIGVPQSRRCRAPSVIPPRARAQPGDEPCVSLGHVNLGYVEEIDHPRRGVRRLRLIEAVCMECSRPQSEVRIIYPADAWLRGIRPWRRLWGGRGGSVAASIPAPPDLG